MAFRSAQQARAYVGQLAAACYARSVDSQNNISMLSTTTLCDDEKSFIPGKESGVFSVSGPLDTDASSDAQYDALLQEKASTTPTPITYMPLGTDGAAWLIDGVQTSIDLSTGEDQTVDWSMTAATTGKLDHNGVILENNTEVTADTNGSSTAAPAGTTNGAVAHLHVTAFSGLTSDDITIEGSGTGAFAGEEVTVFTFTQVTGVTSERVEVTGTVGRYLRVVDDVTGTGSITRMVSVARR